MLIINIVAFISALIFTMFIVKLYRLVYHKSILILFFASILGIFVRGIRLLPNFLSINNVTLLNISDILASAFFILLAIGMFALYVEVKRIFIRKYNSHLRGK